jgi:hypothetical protein
VHTEPIPPRKLNPALPARFESIIQKCMEKDPSARYQTGEELAHELSELRTSKTATNTSIATTRVMTAAGDDDATLIEAVPTVPKPVVVATASQPVANTPASASKRNSKMWLAVAAVIVAASASAGWYILHARQSPPPPLTTTSSTPAPAPAPTTAPAPIVPDTNAVDAASPVPMSKTAAGNKPKVAKPSPGASITEKKPSIAAPPNAGASLSAKSTPAAPKSEPLGFDPMTLDPKQNARLKIDASGMPRGLDFTVEMNGRVYSHNSGAIGQDSFVPPGVQEFRVSAKSGAVQQTSNTVSADFLQKKKHTLKVELRLKGQSANAGMPQGLYPDSQIVLTLK